MTKGFTKGYDPKRNIKGRPKGAKNRTTEQLRQLLLDFVNDNIEDLQASFDKLDHKDKLIFLERILKYVLPSPINELEKLTDEQLDEIIRKLKSNNY